MSDRKHDPTDPLDVAQRLAYNKALADAKAAVQAYQEKWNRENESDFERNQIFNECVFAIEALEVKL